MSEVTTFTSELVHSPMFSRETKENMWVHTQGDLLKGIHSCDYGG